MKYTREASRIMVVLTSLCAGLLMMASPIMGESAKSNADREAMIQEFEEKNKAKNEMKADALMPLEEKGGLEELKQVMAQSRLDLVKNTAPAYKKRAAEATLNYVNALLRMENEDEALRTLETSLEMGADAELLVAKYAEITSLQSDDLIKAGDLPGAKTLLLEARAKAKNFNIKKIHEDLAQRIVNLLKQMAVNLRREGNYLDAKSVLIEALTWRVDMDALNGMMGVVCFHLDEPKEAIDHLRIAVKGDMRGNKELEDLIALCAQVIESERNYAVVKQNSCVFKYPSTMVFDSKKWDEPIAKARAAAETMFKMQSAMPVQISIISRKDFAKMSLQNAWMKVRCAHGRVFLREDALSSDAAGMGIIARYLVGLWLSDVESLGKCPEWLREGIALQLAFSGGPSADGVAEIKSRAKKKSLQPAYETGKSFMLIQSNLDAAVAMTQSQIAVQKIIDEKGLDNIPKMLAGFIDTASEEATLKEFGGLSYSGVDKAVSGASAPKKNRKKTQADAAVLRGLGYVSPVGALWEK